MAITLLKDLYRQTAEEASRQTVSSLISRIQGLIDPRAYIKGGRCSPKELHRSRKTLNCSVSCQDDYHAVQDSMFDHRDDNDDDQGFGVDIDDLSGIGSVFLDWLLEDHDGCSSTRSCLIERAGQI